MDLFARSSPARIQPRHNFLFFPLNLSICHTFLLTQSPTCLPSFPTQHSFPTQTSPPLCHFLTSLLPANSLSLTLPFISPLFISHTHSAAFLPLHTPISLAFMFSSLSSTPPPPQLCWLLFLIHLHLFLPPILSLLTLLFLYSFSLTAITPPSLPPSHSSQSL